jgi:hypothetical protein
MAKAVLKGLYMSAHPETREKTDQSERSMRSVKQKYGTEKLPSNDKKVKVK